MTDGEHDHDTRPNSTTLRVERQSVCGGTSQASAGRDDRGKEAEIESATEAAGKEKSVRAYVDSSVPDFPKSFRISEMHLAPMSDNGNMHRTTARMTSNRLAHDCCENRVAAMFRVINTNSREVLCSEIETIEEAHKIAAECESHETEPECTIQQFVDGEWVKVA